MNDEQFKTQSTQFPLMQISFDQMVAVNLLALMALQSVNRVQEEILKQQEHLWEIL